MKDIFATLLIKLLGHLPVKINRQLGKLTGWLLWASNSKYRFYTEINIAICYPGNSIEQNAHLTKASLIETGITFFELAATWCQKPSTFLNRITTVEGEELLKQAINDNKGVIILAPHLGNWEIVNYFMTRYYSMTAMYKPPKLKSLDQLIYKARTQLGMNAVPANNHGVIALFKALKKQQIAGILPDQEPDRSGGIFSPLFNTDALTPVIASKLLAKTNSVAIGAYCLRQPNGRYKMVFKQPDPAIYSKDLAHSVKGLNLSIERFIADAPEQYQWEYRRYSKRPNNEPKLYKIKH